ncbi:transposase DNA-binding-containing protein, partial [Microcoleus sp. F10-B4]|uniref:IS4/Tn5 family transposase DNA-binding protein n=1 Tax=unclassified Microcoleus TaxID=2642155 RepID=UPI002FD0FBA6
PSKSQKSFSAPISHFFSSHTLIQQRPIFLWGGLLALLITHIYDSEQVMRQIKFMNRENFTDPQKWALEQWGDVDLGDSRQTNRALEVGAGLAQNPYPSAGLPTQMESWNQLKAAYRLLGNEN